MVTYGGVDSANVKKILFNNQIIFMINFILYSFVNYIYDSN